MAQLFEDIVKEIYIFYCNTFIILLACLQLTYT